VSTSEVQKELLSNVAPRDDDEKFQVPSSFIGVEVGFVERPENKERNKQQQLQEDRRYRGRQQEQLSISQWQRLQRTTTNDDITSTASS
jgi:hypothetical protein